MINLANWFTKILSLMLVTVCIIQTGYAGDRVKPRGASIDDGKIILEMLQAGENDAMCCPTLLATRRWSLKNTQLQESEIEITGQLLVDETIRVLSWNISGDAFVAEQSEFRSLLRWGNPDVVLLDEVSPRADPAELKNALTNPRTGDDDAWSVNFGTSGGRQRCVIASRARQEALPEFSEIVPYPMNGRMRILASAPVEKHPMVVGSMNDGIPINGAVILIGDQRLLVVITDLQCCGDGPDSWEEIRRRVEADEIRRLLQQILRRTTVDGFVFAGDFNLVESTFPMALLTGPYPVPHSGLIPAELYHPDGITTWTWDGRGTPFPSDTLDYQLYGPSGLKMRTGFILDTEKLPAEILEPYGLETDTVGRTGSHRPLVVEYSWK